MKNKDNPSEMPEVILKKTGIKSSIPSICTDENSANDIKKTSQISGKDHFNACDTNNGSTHDLMYKSCTDYSSRVWNVVRAELQDSNFLVKQ